MRRSSAPSAPSPRSMRESTSCSIISTEQAPNEPLLLDHVVAVDGREDGFVAGGEDGGVDADAPFDSVGADGFDVANGGCVSSG